MLQSLKRLLTPTRKRSLDAAAAGRRWASAPAINNLNRDVLAGGSTVRRRAAYYARNNCWASAGVDSLVANIIGAGIVPQPAHPDASVRAMLSSDFLRWTDAADLTGRSDFYGLQALVVRQMVETGEALARMVMRDGTLRIQLLHPDQLPADLIRDEPGGVRIRGGVELDVDGAPVAYHIHRARPGEQMFTALGLPRELIRVPASEICHVFLPLEPGQVRGLSWLGPILARLNELDQFDDAQLLRQKISAMFAGFIYDADGTGADLAQTPTDQPGIFEGGLEPGTLKTLPPGSDIKFSDPAELGEYAAFVKAQIRAAAAGLGVTYEQISGDYEGVTYSSVRASLVEFRRRVEQIQHQVVVHQFCRPVWNRWARMQAFGGRIEPTAFDADPDAFLAVNWLPPRFDWVDPSKDVNAEIAAIDARLKSRRQAVAERGVNIEDLDREIAADADRLNTLGLTGAPVAKPADQVTPATEEDTE